MCVYCEIFDRMPRNVACMAVRRCLGNFYTVTRRGVGHVSDTCSKLQL
jgi:hypothetical protein